MVVSFLRKLLFDLREGGVMGPIAELLEVFTYDRNIPKSIGDFKKRMNYNVMYKP